MVPLAEALRERGHVVAFTTGPNMGPDLERAGFELMDGQRELASIIAQALARYPDNKFRTGTIEDQSRFAFHRVFSEARVSLDIGAALTNAEAFAPDLIVNDFCDFIGPLVGAVRGIPNATVGVGLVLQVQSLRLSAEGAAPSWRRCGLEPRGDGGLYRSLYLNQVPRSMQLPLPDAVPTSDLRPVSVGEGEPMPADLDHLGIDRPLIYVTFGTAFGERAPMQQTVDALAGVDADVLITTGSRGSNLSEELPPNIHARTFVPQGAVLKRCHAVVTHGGSGSFLGALRYGVPMVVTPLGADHEKNADQVARSGAGLKVLTRDLDDHLRPAVVDVLVESSYREEAHRLRDEIALMPTPRDVVPTLEELAGQT
jgi:UDP:flavonoid glycosyltransferase YjiC (YdhE family)